MTEDPLKLAIEYEQSGRLAEAENLCKSILERQPDNAAAWHVASMIAARAGRPDLAITRIQKAITLNPQNPAMHANLGEYHRRLGNLDTAILSLRRSLEFNPAMLDAWNNLGNAFKDKGLLDDALAAYNKALALQPNSAMVHYNIGIAHRLKGDLNQSLVSFDRALEIAPTYAEAHSGRGNTLRDQGRLDEAIAEYKRAIQLNQNLPASYANLGAALAEQRQFDSAITTYQHALRLNPKYPEVLANLAAALREIKRFDEAFAAAQAAIQLKPDYAEAHHNLGSILFDQEKFDEAIQSFQKAIDLKPASPLSHNNLALVLDEIGKHDEAIHAARTAVKLQPNYAFGWNTLGNLLVHQGQYQEAKSALHQAIHLQPDYAMAHWNISLIHLLEGDLETGWIEHEWRKQTDIESRPREFPQPEWLGQELNGQTILIHAEQGFGDTIQFIRYIPMVASRGARVLFQCPADLSSLLRHSLKDAEIVSAADLPEFDYHCPLLSLPAIFKTRLDSIPSQTPYLKSPPESSAKWREILNQIPATKRIGFVWAGNPKRKLDRQRSLRLDQLAPLASVPGIQYYSLQKGDSAKQVINPPPNMNLIDLTEKLTDFAETAALIDNLDLVITVDTAVAHLAGAMAKPVWVLLGYVPAWRWLLNRAHSPWYPTMRLFRQSEMDNWTTPIAQVKEALHVFANK
jgi:tetratricopeptide (TPR) repeat protein